MRVVAAVVASCLSLVLHGWAGNRREQTRTAQSQAAPAARPLRVVIAGLVHGHVEGFLQRNQHRPDLEIVGIAEPNRQLAAKYAGRFKLEQNLFYSDLDDAIRKTLPDAVLDYSDTYDHRRVAEVCARHGVHLMMEKPLAVSLEDAHAIEKAAGGGKIHVLVNYETTWYRSNHAAYSMLHDGSIGEARKIVVHDGHPGPKEIGVAPEFLRWLTDPKLNGGGALFDFGCYGADLATWLMDGQQPEAVTAVVQQIKPQVYPHVDDEATVILTYPRAQVIVQASWNWPFDRKDLEVYGATGYVLTVRHDDIRVRRGSEKEEEQIAAPPIAAPYDDPISELRAVIFDGAQPDRLTSLETNVMVTQILEAARLSAAGGTTVRLPTKK